MIARQLIYQTRSSEPLQGSKMVSGDSLPPSSPLLQLGPSVHLHCLVYNILTFRSVILPEQANNVGEG